MGAFRAGHAGCDSRQNEDAFESLAKNENANVERSDGLAGVRLVGIRRALRENSLPDENGDYRQGSD